MKTLSKAQLELIKGEAVLRVTSDCSLTFDELVEALSQATPHGDVFAFESFEPWEPYENYTCEAFLEQLQTERAALETFAIVLLNAK